MLRVIDIYSLNYRYSDCTIFLIFGLIQVNERHQESAHLVELPKVLDLELATIDFPKLAAAARSKIPIGESARRYILKLLIGEGAEINAIDVIAREPLGCRALQGNCSQIRWSWAISGTGDLLRRLRTTTKGSEQ